LLQIKDKMRLLIQRVTQAKVEIEGKIKGEIGQGLLVLQGICAEDTKEDIEWLTKKLIQMRIFTDEEGKMNLSVQDIQGEILIISQFTLYANTRKGNRPSFIQAAPPSQAIPLYESFIKKTTQMLQKPVATGEFGADMQVSLVNDGPVTIWIDSKQRE
jgi:D-tyrosyl-tRNA(Tyr) deacylase